MRTGVVYIATINHDKSYIGFTVDFERRKTTHLRLEHDVAFHHAIRKYGADAIDWRILEDDIPEHRLPDREVLWIAFYDTYYNGYNMTMGGEASPMSNPEVAAKVSATLRAKSDRGEHPSQRPEFRDKMKARAASGEWVSPTTNPEVAAKVSATQLAQSAEGKHHAQQPSARANMSKSRKALVASGRWVSPTTDPEVAAKVSVKMLERSARRENPMQIPEIASRIWQTRKRLNAEKTEHHQKDAGQQFWCELPMKEKNDE